MKETDLKFKWNVIGHASILSYLEKNIENNKIDHAYLFSGTESLGKRKTADELIKILQCFKKKDLDTKNVLPCNICLTCDQLNQGIHPDVYIVEREEGKKNISIEQVRKLQHRLSVSSFYNSLKIGLIDEAESLTLEAANSLLKTLEEPTKDTVMILITKDNDLLPQTVVSRCHSIKFQPVKSQEIFNYLLSRKLARGQSLIFTNLAKGKPGIAIKLFIEPDYYSEYQDKVSDFIDILGSSLRSRLRLIEDSTTSFSKFPEKIKVFERILNIWNSVLRDILIINFDKRELIVNKFVEKKLIELAPNHPPYKILDYLKLVDKIRYYLRNNINPRLALENFVINL